MAEIRVVPVSKGDLIQSTYHMDATEFGAYFRLLLVHYDMPDGLPDDDQKLMRWAGCSAKVWKRIKPTVMAKFQVAKDQAGNPKYVQRRTLLEIQRIKERTTIAKDKALKRWNNGDAAASDQHDVSNATLNTKPKPEPERLTPPTPTLPLPTPVDKPVDGGGRSSAIAVSGGGIGFQIMPQLDDAAIAAARKAAPGWDIYALAAIYDSGIADGTRERPTHPRKAFPAWCAKYTKGSPPK